MTELLSTAQMRAIEAAAINAGGITGRALMEHAGQGVVDAICAAWPDLGDGSQAVVLCGPGNNGGDGYVVARLLAALGWGVAVFATGPAQTPDSVVQQNLWVSGGGSVRPLSQVDWPDMRAADVVVDAVFGIGLRRDIAPGIWGSLIMAQESGARLVAVDILSGICGDSGRIRAEGGYLDHPAALTVTFQRPKLGHMLADGAALSGALRVVDLGLDAEIDALLRGPDADSVVDAASASASWLGKMAGHKFSHGHALVLSGPPGQGGAARLAARGALRVGAGLVTLGCPPDAVAEHAAQLTAIMIRPIGTADDLRATLSDPRITALCLGPGLGVPQAHDLLAQLIGQPKGPQRHVVLDADALTALSQAPDLFAKLHDSCVLTPHGGEFARLFPDLAARLSAPAGEGAAYSKVDATRDAARRSGCTVLFKGADTVIAAPSGACVINAAVRADAAPWLATAGAGDVLAGMIAGLLARGFGPFAAAQNAAWLHAQAARSFGPGLIAEDLPEELPKVFRALGM